MVSHVAQIVQHAKTALSTNVVLRDSHIGRVDQSFLSVKSSPYPPSCSSVQGQVTDYIIYFIPGNPGLIRYYHSFLTSLSKLIKPHPKARLVLLGRTIQGLEVHPQDYGLPTGYSWEKSTSSVDEQVEFFYQELKEAAQEWSASTNHLHPEGEKRNVRFILVGHSMGSYISMELTKRFMNEAQDRELHQSQAGALKRADVNDDTHNLVMAVSGQALLFPALLEIAQSNNGRVFNFFIKWRISWLVVYIGAFLLSIIPSWSFVAILKFLALILNNPSIDHPITMQFLRVANGRGITRAMTLGASEMNSIKGDSWAPAVWGLGPKQAHTESTVAENPQTTENPQPAFYASPRVYYFFADYDGWVSSSIRDRMIAEKQEAAKKQERASPGHFQTPIFEVDQTGLEHAFCLDELQSYRVAEKVAQFVNSIVNEELLVGKDN